ncbi:MAG: hypothetical protein JRM97_09025 [Nitrososphaerota archaeon]|nr:hypothetical protein [Nitrososphaerota archaeon]
MKSNMNGRPRCNRIQLVVLQRASVYAICIRVRGHTGLHLAKLGNNHYRWGWQKRIISDEEARELEAL